MPRLDRKAAILLAIFSFALCARAQDKAASAAEKEHFYYHSWKKDEIKVCESYSGAPNVLICDSDDDMTWSSSFLNLISDNRRKGMGDINSYKNALKFALDRGKVYPATFSDIPWPMPQTGYRMSIWSCSKDKNDTVSCGLGSRSTKDATGE